MQDKTTKGDFELTPLGNWGELTVMYSGQETEKNTKYWSEKQYNFFL